MSKKLTTRQDEDCTKVCLLDHEQIKNYDRLIAVDLSRQKELDDHPKTIQQIKFTEQLTILVLYILMVNNLLVLTILEKVKQKRLKCFQGSISLIKDDKS